jgi:hypothetical protein
LESDAGRSSANTTGARRSVNRNARVAPIGLSSNASPDDTKGDLQPPCQLHLTT